VAVVKERLIEVIEELDEADAAQVLEYAESLRDAEEWDRQIERDSKPGGKLWALAEQARREYEAGQTKPL
jgi:hypothetical protein